MKFYQDLRNGKYPVREYVKSLGRKERAKVAKYIEFLRVNKGYLDEPYSKHIIGKIRELRVDFSKNHHRIFYFTFIRKTIILLHAFLKKTKRTSVAEINKAQKYYQDIIQNPKAYE